MGVGATGAQEAQMDLGFLGTPDWSGLPGYPRLIWASWVPQIDLGFLDGGPLRGRTSRPTFTLTLSSPLGHEYARRTVRDSCVVLRGVFQNSSPNPGLQPRPPTSPEENQDSRVDGSCVFVVYVRPSALGPHPPH